MFDFFYIVVTSDLYRVAFVHNEQCILSNYLKSCGKQIECADTLPYLDDLTLI